MAVDEECGAWQETGIHAHAFTSVNFDDYEPLPLFAIALEFGFQLFEKRLLEFKDFFHVHAGDERFSRGDAAVGEDHVLKFVVARGQDRSALVDFSRIEKVQHREMLYREHSIHSFNAEAPLAVQEIGYMSLLEASLLCQP